MRRLFVLLLSLFLFSSSESVRPQGRSSRPKQLAANASPPTGIPAATLSVSFGRHFLREGDSVPVDVWISNTSEQSLTNVRVEISSPKFMHWHKGSCDQAEITDKSLSEAQIPAHKTLSYKLCVSTDNEIDVGDFNILFSLTYEWTVNGVTRQSFVTNEKTIKMNLFGSESVAGVPLALAGFIVPGLFFWIFMHLWKVPVNQETSKELVYSVLISVVVIGLGYLLRQVLSDWKWLSFFDIRNGISVTKLFALASTGIVLGNIVGGAYYACLRWKKSKIISPSDPLITKVLKIVKQNSQFQHPKTLVRIKDSPEVFTGSLSANNQGTVWLIGWFKIDIRPYANDKDFVRKIKDSEAKGDTAKLLRLAREKKIQLEQTNQITVNDQPKGELLSWNEAELSGQPQKTEDANVKELIEIVDNPNAGQ